MDETSAGVVRPYEPSLDGLRALSGIAIFGVHLEQTVSVRLQIGPFRLEQVLQNGRLGVAMFLLLSGYCLALPLWVAAADGRLSTAIDGFLTRRFARIVPLYWVVLAAMWLGHLFRDAEAAWQWWAHFAFVHNLWPESLYSISEPFWAIALIVQYYLFWYCLLCVLRLLRCDSDRSLMLAFGGLSISAWSLAAILELTNGDFSNGDASVWRHGLPIHLPIFLTGAMTGWLTHRSRNRIPGWLSETAVMLGVLVLFFAMAYAPVGFGLPASRYAFPLVPALFAAIVYLAIRSHRINRALSGRWLVFGGKISYAFYLVHFPVIRLTRRGLREIGITPSSLVLAIVSFTLACLVAWTLTRVIEQPIRHFLTGRARGADVSRS
ncbi:MAG: acyltransferase [Planctomycetota bacterium]